MKTRTIIAEREVIKSMIFGYTRVSKTEQNLNRQLDQLQAEGCEKIFSDKITGMTIDRPELIQMMEQLRSGDTIIVTELSRFGRSVKDLLALAETLDKKGVNLKSIKEPWADTTTAQGRMLFVIFAGISQFERDLISQRTKEGLAKARFIGINRRRLTTVSYWSAKNLCV